MKTKPMMAEVGDRQELFPISVVAEATGVPTVTLRAWERRYGFLVPHRTPKGHRLFSVEHIGLIRRVTALLDSGIPVSRVGDLLKLENLQPATASEGDNWDRIRSQMLDAINDFDEMRLDQLYNDSLANFPISMVTDELIIPLLRRVGTNWEHGVKGVAEEHFFSLYIRNKLGSRWHHSPPMLSGRRIVAACMPGDRHEYGLLLFALVARSRGFDLVLLGADMPLEEIAKVVDRTRAAGVVISTTLEPGWQIIERDLRKLAEQVPCPVFVGGSGIAQQADAIAAVGARPVGVDLVAGVEEIHRYLHDGEVV